MFEIRTHYFNSVPELHVELRKHTEGRQSEWHGSFAAVYPISPEVVMKISGGDDLGYLEFLKTMKELAVKNKHLPVIHSVDYYRLTDEARKNTPLWMNRERIVTYMERLSQPPKYYRVTYKKPGDIYSPIMKKETPPARKWIERISHYVLAPVAACSHLSLEHQELIVLLKIAHEMYMAGAAKQTGSKGLDLHAGNMLARGKTLVITDPLA